MTHLINSSLSFLTPRSLCGGKDGRIVEDPRLMDCEACQGQLALHLVALLGLEIEADYDQREICSHGEGDACSCPPEPLQTYSWEEGYTDRLIDRNLSIGVAQDLAIWTGGVGVEGTASSVRSTKKDFASKGEAALDYLRVMRARIDAVLGSKS